MAKTLSFAALDILLAFQCAFAGVLEVPAKFSTIQTAIDMASDGDTVLVSPGEYNLTEPIEFNRLHDPANSKSPPLKNVILRSEVGAAETIIRMQTPPPDFDSSILIIDKGETRATVVQGFTLTAGGGSGPLRNGGGIRIEGSSPTILECIIASNSIPGRGGGIYCRGGSPLIRSCVITGNSAGDSGYGGALYCEDGSTLELVGCSIRGNSASHGGGIFSFMGRNEVRLIDCELIENVARFDGAAIEAEYGSVFLTDCRVLRNRGGRSIIVAGDSRVTRCVFEENEGGADCRGSTVIEECTFSSNGLGVICGSQAVLHSSMIRGNARSGLELLDNATAKRCVITRNGVGVRCYGSSALEECTITENEGEEGAGVIAEGSPRIVGCHIARNAARKFGGGLYCRSGFVKLESCRIEGNSARIGGGGLHGGSFELSRCTIVQNSAEQAGAIEGRGGTLFMASCTIAGNTSARGTAMLLSFSSVNIVDSIVFWNAPGPVHSEPLSNLTVEHSCIEGEEVSPGDGNINQDPLFCGWKGSADVYVDASALESGDGSPARPYREISEALDFDYAISGTSPCIGAARNGADMGAPNGNCPEGRPRSPRRVYLAAGRYTTQGNTLAHEVSLLGAGSEATALEGTIHGLRTEAVLERLSVVGGRSSGVAVPFGESPTLRDCVISDNQATQGGGIQCWASSVRLERCTLKHNVAEKGGAIYGVDGALDLAGCVILENLAEEGAAIFSANEAVTIVDSAISRNVATGRIANSIIYSAGWSTFREWKPHLALSKCVLESNFVAQHGGGVVQTTLLEAPFEARITGCSILGNRAFGVISQEGLWLSNCVVAGNSGAGIASSGGTIRNCTIADNDAVGLTAGDSGGGVSVVSSILWGNAPADDVRGDPSISYSCIEGALPAGAGNIGEDPRFVRRGLYDFGRTSAVRIAGVEHSLPDYVIEKGDYSLGDGSPCMDSGDPNAAPDSDFDGHGRPCGVRGDMGAFEHGGCEAVTPFRRGDANADAEENVSDAIFVLAWLFQGGESPACEKAGDLDDNGTVDLTDAIVLLMHLFLGAAPPPPPRSCGPDPTSDPLSCAAFSPCG